MGAFSSKPLKKTQRQNKLILHFNKKPKSKKRLSVYKIIESQDYNDVPSSPYPIINNEYELKKMEYIHKSFKIFWGNNFSAPVKEVLELGNATVLDIGCGQGCWILDMAHDYPMSIFIGVDFFPMFPKNRPQNVGFLKEDVLNGIPFPDDTFDYVHQRNLMLAYREEQWIEVIEEIIRVTKPGGLIEIIEFDCEIYQSGPLIKLLEQKIKSKIASRGIDYNINKRLPNIIDKANLIDDIVSTSKQMPLNSNDSALGRMGGEIILNSIKSLAIDGIGNKEYESIVAELNDPDYKPYLVVSRICAKKVL